MPRSITTGNRRARDDESEDAAADKHTTEPRKRRAFLQTMGQQLREFGAQGTSPQDHARHTFGTNPIESHISIATESATGPMSNHQMGTPENDAAPGEDDQLPAGAAGSATKWLWTANEVRNVVFGRDDSVFDFEDLLDWSQSYFDHWHPAFPFVHAPALLDHFRTIAAGRSAAVNSSASNIFQSIILRSIMSISIFDRRQTKAVIKPLPSTIVFHSFHDAIRSISTVLTEESSVLSLQALTSVQLFLLTMHRYNAASRLSGLAMRIVYQLDLHRCRMDTHSKSDDEIKLRKRLFWSIYCIERYVCIRLGNPLGMRSDDINVCYPQSEVHGNSQNNTHESEGRDGRLDLLEFLARHAQIRGSIMENRSKPAMEGLHQNVDHTMQTEAEHSKWWNTVDEYLSNDEQEKSFTRSHQVTLIILRNETIIALNRSTLAATHRDMAYHVALQRCITASRFIINTLHKALQGSGGFGDSPGAQGYEVIPLLWPSFTWATWMSAFVIIHAATEDQVPRNVALRLADRSIQVLRHIALRGTNWPEACIVAIENLKARINGISIRSSTTGSRQFSNAPRRVTPVATDMNGHPLRTRATLTELQNSRVDSNHTMHSQAILQDSSSGPSMPQMVSAAFPYPLSASYTDNFDPTSQRYNHPDVQPQGINDWMSFASAHLGGPGSFLGIAQQSSDNPRSGDEIMQFFGGEDITNWAGGGTNVNFR